MLDHDRRMKDLLALSKKEGREFRALPPDEQRKVALRRLQKIGILTRRGNLAPAFR